jgi:hypothetical protein
MPMGIQNRQGGNMERELGTATQPCPTCDRALAVVVLEDGASSTVRCDHCYPETLVEVAAASSLPREYGSDVDEEGEDDD